ncbi:MAG: SDR family NAD(P)-dependent oxidoreductase [Rhodobacteraceae bacterium]|nr:SDR family NAD(P)-dependent oxidoreductase [Paracoccaceae bacterium]
MKRPTQHIWIDTFFPRQSTDRVPDQDLTGTMIVLTGGTDGMGRVAAERLASMGADICLMGRNMAKTQRVIADLKAAGHEGNLLTVACDLGSLDSVRKAAADILEACPRIDLLINCAGANIMNRQCTAEGYEMNFVVNYLGPFLLTELLLERVTQAPAARIINVTSATQAKAHLDFADLHRETGWTLFSTYAQAKLCMIIHTRDMAARLNESGITGVTVNSLNPGYIQSNLSRDSKGWVNIFVRLFNHRAAPTWVGGERIVAMALGKKYEDLSGAYIYEDVQASPNPEALDTVKAARLLDLSYEMTGLTRPRRDM